MWAGMCTAAAIISGQGLGCESLKGLTTGQNMCKKPSSTLWACVCQVVLCGVQGERGPKQLSLSQGIIPRAGKGRTQ